MGKQYDALTDKLTAFIAEQPIFFVATATADSSINLSPKGMDSLRVVNPNRIIWLNVTGSGNETAAHVAHDGRMTIMWCAFKGNPMILRAYGRATAVHQADPDWPTLAKLLPQHPGTRQIFDLRIERVQTSCGMAVPLMDFVDHREALNDWARRKGPDGIRDYWAKTNQSSIDGLPTDVVAKNEPSQ